MFKYKSKCSRCKSKTKDSWDFCPFCGLDLRNPEEESRDFGNIGKSDFIGGAPLAGGLGGLGISDKMINGIFNSLMKNLEKQMKNVDPSVQKLNNGIKISFGVPNNGAPKKRAVRKGITQEQIKRMEGLPRVEAKSSVRRFSNRVVYELGALGVDNPNDVFISKLENGYEVKAIGKKKVYVNSLPIELPLKEIKISKNSLNIEFGSN